MARMPKKADPVMQIPARATSSGTTHGLSGAISLATGMANMATPTPNQPICVKLMRAEGR